ncbi:S9 family peptidase [Allokutzneria albata]|uniref:Dipeptidyl aminopeptidase/acylaminoacyl peptidase n=1 Tax=Allokutzneria albata TaxID=211114 RepID=A0A1G9UIG3_ALLAB|nr:prolyl oligopeptidase family serine peptidase [Allokutzneria albata]SDM59623.1 Dipeptidyl aminopeptidase/acylaminoacyl peptidase [Allokutzneria albata]
MPELTAELIVDGKVPRRPVISPDGCWVVYTVHPLSKADEHPVAALWLAATDGGAPPRQLTAGTALDIAPRWAPDSAAVYFLSDRAERGTPQLHRIRLDGGEAEPLTAWKGGISDHLPLADPGVVALVAADEPTEEDERRERERDDARVYGERVRYARVRLLSLADKQIAAPIGPSERHVVELAQRPGGGPLALLSWPDTELDACFVDSAVHVVDLSTRETREICRTPASPSGLTWWRSGDDWRLAFLATTPPGPVGGEAVFSVDEPGQPDNLSAGMPMCPISLAAPASGGLLALFAHGLDSALHRIDTRTELSTMDGFADALTVSSSGAVVAALRSTSYAPVDVHSGPPEGPLTPLSHTRPELREITWGRQERLAYKASDGLELDGLLVLPPGKTRADGPFPLVTILHGGPYDRDADKLSVHWAPSGQWFATGGCAVFLANPRGGAGHGHEFAASVAGAVGVDDWTDILAGIDLLVAEGVADPQRLGFAGWSQGGFMAAWAVGQTDRFRAAVMGAGISDWGQMVAAGELATYDGTLGGSAGWEGVGPHRHDRLSPISHAAKVTTPVLILHGELDPNVPLAQGEYFHRALRALGVEHEYVVYPREKHSIAERAHQLDVLRRSRDWFTRWL